MPGTSWKTAIIHKFYPSSSEKKSGVGLKLKSGA